MVKTCPSCGTPAVDDKSLFCNKCGYPFPKTRPDSTTIVRRPDTRLNEPPSPVQREAPPPPPRAAPVKRAGPGAGRKKAPFRTFIAQKHLRLIYFLGVIGIVLVSLIGISAVFSRTGTDAANISFTNTTALVETPSASPLFWIAFLIIGNLIWRVFCELVAAVFRIYDTLSRGGSGTGPDDETLEYGGEIPGDYVECPHCGKVVPPEELRECEHCGVQGCSTCIRGMGLLKKTLTCRNCFERK